MGATIAIIIPTLNSPTLGAVIAAVQAQMIDRSNFDLVVVGRDDDQVALDAGARHVAGDRTLNPAEARNLGIRSTTAEYLIFLDSDCIPEPWWLVAMLRWTANKQVVVSGGMRIVADHYLRLAGNLSTFHDYTTALAPTERPYLPTFSMGVSRQAIARVGGFDERLPRAEDLDFTIRLKCAGFQLRFEPTASVIHRPQRLTVSRLVEHSIQSGQCSIRVRHHYPDVFRMPKLLLKWPVLLASAPAVAGTVTIMAWMQNRDVRRFWQALPIIFLTRYLWIIGACETLRAESSM